MRILKRVVLFTPSFFFSESCGHGCLGKLPYSSIPDSLLNLYNPVVLPRLLPDCLDHGTPQIYPNLRCLQLHLTWTQLFSPTVATLQPSGSHCLWPKQSPSEVGGPDVWSVWDYHCWWWSLFFSELRTAKVGYRELLHWQPRRKFWHLKHSWVSLLGNSKIVWAERRCFTP